MPWRACANCRYQVKRHALAAAFQAWKMCASFSELFLRPWLRQVWQAQALFRGQLAALSHQLRDARTQDRAAYLSECAKLADSGKHREAFAAVGRLLGHQGKKLIAPDVLPHLLDAAGEPCETHEAIAARWKQHFGDDIRRTTKKRAPLLPTVPVWKPVPPVPQSSAGILTLLHLQARLMFNSPTHLTLRFLCRLRSPSVSGCRQHATHSAVHAMPWLIGPLSLRLRRLFGVLLLRLRVGFRRLAYGGE